MITLPLLLLLQIGGDMAPETPAGLEGRAPAPERSVLQARVDAAPSGATLLVEAGTYPGDLVIEKPLALIGSGRPLLLGSGAGSVVRVRAGGVTIEGFDVDGRGGGDLARDSSGVHVAARNVTVRGCRIRNALFGIYLREADGARVVRCRIDGIPGKDPGEKGSGIHVWSTNGFALEENVIHDVRDGFYIQSSSHGTIRGNEATDLRYGIHYMYSDDNAFEDNLFAGAAAGSAIMYSRRIVFRRNRFLHNRGFASVGLLLKVCDDVLAEDNLIADNARGIFLEGSQRDLIRRNVVAESDTAIVLYDSCEKVRFEGNSFVANLTPLTLSGKRTDTVFLGNYWSENEEPDLDGDGFSDAPYRLTSVFDHFRGNLTAADLLAQSFAGTALGVAERTFPVLEPVSCVDERPLARPPALPRVPRAASVPPRASVPALAGSTALLLSGLVVMAAGRRSKGPA